MTGKALFKQMQTSIRWSRSRPPGSRCQQMKTNQVIAIMNELLAALLSMAPSNSSSPGLVQRWKKTEFAGLVADSQRLVDPRSRRARKAVPSQHQF